MTQKEQSVNPVHRYKSFLFEFEDLSWFPDTIRRSMVDYLSFFLVTTDYYKPVIPLIAECLEHSTDKHLVDLCSGGGGPILRIQENLAEYTGTKVPITLTDKFPNTEAYTYLNMRSGGSINYEAQSVDATAVPTHLKGVRTCFSALHHFNRDNIKKILRNATQQGCPVAIFDGGDKNIFTILGIIIVHPVLFVLCTPFFKPFRFSRYLFTYLIPIIPLCTIWDGAISIMRLYSPGELEEIAKEVNSSYYWKAGKKRHALGFHTCYLVGYPA